MRALNNSAGKKISYRLISVEHRLSQVRSLHTARIAICYAAPQIFAPVETDSSA